MSKVIDIEEYGHIVLDISIEDFEKSGFALGDIVHVSSGDFSMDMPFFNGYYVDRGEYLLNAYPGNTNISVGINYGNFTKETGIGIGDEVTISLKEKAGALSIQNINNIVYTNNRADYDSDEIFANFRPITAGRIAKGALYRSASPVDNKYNRAAYANPFAEAVHINTVVNIPNTNDDIERFFLEKDFSSAYYKQLYEKGNVIALGLPIDYTSDGFPRGIASGLSFMSKHEPPYLVHCIEGKDRAGFISMVLEAFMGAKIDEIVDDYMISYINYYKIKPHTKKYEAIINRHILPMLCSVVGTDAPKTVNMADATADYLIQNGMPSSEIKTLREKLSGF